MRTSSLAVLLFAVHASSLPAQSLSPTPVPELSADGSSAVVLDKARRAEVVETMARAAEQRYVDAEGGARIAARLRDQLLAGAYDAAVDPNQFAAALTRDLQEAVPDVHLRAVYEPDRAQRGLSQRMVPAGGTPAPYARIDRRSDVQIAATNFGFEKVEWLTGNIGYLKLTRLVPLSMSRDAAARAMAQLSGSDAVIIDLRGVPGGSPDLVVQLVSYFASSKPVRLMTTYNRSLDETEELWSLADIPGNRLSGVPLYILQDRKTASAAEMLSYFVQRQKLGTVVGEKSAGAGNGGNMIPVGSNISFFLSQFRITDGPGWEAKGITPDIPSSSADALEVARSAAFAAIEAKRRKT